MIAQQLLDRLQKVRQIGPGRWVACCPAHEDRSPSLSIEETSDERVLIYCFVGCGALEVLEAVGLDWSSLFPPKEAWLQGDESGPTTTKSGRRRLPASVALNMLWEEAMVLEIVALECLVRGSLRPKDREALHLAFDRIKGVREAWLARP